jgi:geranylgeranyl diphosphate synthase type I
MMTHTLQELKNLSEKIDSALQAICLQNKEPTDLYTLINEFLNYGGKRLRPILCLLSAEACGGNQNKVLPAALAIELFHNFTLIHDDIEDNSMLRRGKSCLHLQHGIPLAINAGDGLFALAYKQILSLDCSAEKKLQLSSMLNAAFLNVIEGQGIELDWIKDKNWNISIDNYMRMIQLKTGALLAIACQAGAILADASEPQQQILYKFGMALGTAFQIQDDVLNLTGNEKQYKKEIGGDVTEGKRTLMVLHALNCTEVSSAYKKHLIGILDTHETDKSEIEWVTKLLIDDGSIDFAQKLATQIMYDGINQLLESDLSINKLIQVTEFLVNRKG